MPQFYRCTAKTDRPWFIYMDENSKTWSQGSWPPITSRQCNGTYSDRELKRHGWKPVSDDEVPEVVRKFLRDGYRPMQREWDNRFTSQRWCSSASIASPYVSWIVPAGCSGLA